MKLLEKNGGLIISRTFLIQMNEDVICIRQKIVWGYKNILDIKCFCSHNLL